MLWGAEEEVVVASELDEQPVILVSSFCTLKIRFFPF